MLQTYLSLSHFHFDVRVTVIKKCSLFISFTCRLIVKKEGQNKGRAFYKCPKPWNEQCKFIEFEDSIDAGHGEQTAGQTHVPSASHSVMSSEKTG